MWMDVRSSPADTQASEEGGGCASCARAKIPLHPMGKTMVRQDAPLQPMEIHGGPHIHLQSLKDPTPAQIKNFDGKTAKRMIKTNSALLRMDNLSYSRRDLSIPLLQATLFSGALGEERNFPPSLSILHKGAGQVHDLEDSSVSAFRKTDARQADSYEKSEASPVSVRATAKIDPPLARAEPIRDGGNASGITKFRNCCES
ncbi:hypothetical protein TURU_167812 [Turdus rufiventris]|nr:hypothetical protein TURU_167812 [Turdus rufiventris]